ncbi:DUF4199 domain-containing protein [Balneola vulgaris]|uniref:DUF4199 domain-containing protein n=1 Tax=Balneola vulgaris TaxID=287535 RepID=UPI000368F2EB|nr:DUF4199 domain-containing protein [Balneola vulgaris]
MKKYALIYGLIAGGLNIGLAAFIFVGLGDAFSHLNNEIFGYLIMILSLSIIFVAVKQYRDKKLGGVIKFKTAFLLGLYISIVASTVYVANWEVYMQTSGSDAFIENYQSSVMEQMKENGASEAKLTEQMEKNEYYKEMYSNVFFRILITYSEILPVALLISLLSAALLKNTSFLNTESS